jgi:hypothetical protein
MFSIILPVYFNPFSNLQLWKNVGLVYTASKKRCFRSEVLTAVKYRVFLLFSSTFLGL